MLSTRCQALLITLFLAALLPACDSAGSRVQVAPASAGTLRIVSSLPLRGVDGVQARQIDRAVDLAISQRSAKSGLWRIEHVSLDDGDSESGEWSAAIERRNATFAAGDPGVVAYVGPYNSGAVGVALPVANLAQLLVLSPSATWPGLTEHGWNPGEPDSYYPAAPRNFVRLSAPDDAQGTAAAEVAAKDGDRSLAVIEDGSSYSDGLAGAFVSRARSLGLSVNGPFTISPSNPLPQELGRNRYDAIFYAPSTAANAFMIARALATKLPELKVYASDTALSDQVAANAGNVLSNWHVIFNGPAELPDTPAAGRFRDAYAKLYGSAPGRFAANAYDATNLVLDAVANGAGDNRLAVLRDVEATSDYEGAGGTITFDKNGDNEYRAVNVYGWQGGKFALLQRLSTKQ